MLHEFIAANRDQIISLCRAKALTHTIRPDPPAASDHGVPLFVEQLVSVLRPGAPRDGEIGRTALLHGHDLLLQGFTASQVVHGYGDVCQAITYLAVEQQAPISTEDFRLLNGCLDEAIAAAVTAHGRKETPAAADAAADGANQRLGFLAHELRNLTNTAIFAFEILKTGNVGVGGSTGAVLQRSLMGTRNLIERAMAEVRLTQGIQNRERLLVSTCIDELVPAAVLLADARRITLKVMPVDKALAVEADRQILSAVVMNLIQNAVKFTRPLTAVTLQVGSNDERVFIEVEDECGGLPSAKSDLFRPFEQRGADRSGMGLGLAFSRWAVEASDGRLSVRNRPGVGCTFIVDLPRIAVRDLAVA
jgi:signal transduction histidine kinase